MVQPKLKKFQTFKPTREEEYIKFYLENSNIKFKEQYRLDNLKYDSKRNRLVDFYLSKFDVYVEYYGLYNSTKEIRKNYDEKTQVYFKNGLPTIILYPHELGILDYAFHSKMVKLFHLDKFKNRKNVFYRYLLKRYLNKGEWRWFLTAVFWAYLFLIFAFEKVKLDESLNALLIFICFFIATYYLLSFIINFIFFFKYKGILE